ncbi:hypothetical protein BN2476_360030 [Paraburkholderia piptadeniae]|uniref:Uncharacterized protein n=1 Tax=Paraburkholderia piptadeniae TaxID=1701573 RepID=A0A1N7SAA0_9BURK|nr:hypothetical protein BN2476_360030 [Paraburkholderia piptadeniae]
MECRQTVRTAMRWWLAVWLGVWHAARFWGIPHLPVVLAGEYRGRHDHGDEAANHWFHHFSALFL